MKGKLYQAIAWLALTCLGTASAVAGTQAAAKPNIVLILADDLGYSDLGSYGGEIHTPNIDALAKRGARFTQFYTSARCCPTRASLMTGLYPSQAGIGDFTTPNPSPDRGPGYLGRLNDLCVTLAEVLKPAGYGCYYVGKWHMHEKTGPILRDFDEFYGFTRDHSHDQYDADYYIRLPEGRKKEIDPPRGEFYATDVFNAYAMEFIRRGQKSGKPWFLFLAHSSPHFPVQAPAERADKYDATYLRGWDVLREERFRRMKDLGLVNGEQWKLTQRSLVPVDRDDIANGYPGLPNPAWDSLDEARQRDLARRMAVFAAMVEGVDQGVGRIVGHLQDTGDLDNTLILFLSDNGACYEWGPWGFDGVSRRGTTTLHIGDDLRKIGGPGTHHSYGSAWANLGNTPLRLYKHFTHEGGIASPFIAHWPRGIGAPDRWIREPAHVMDVMPTLVEAAGASYPETFRGNAIRPMEGHSLLPIMRGGQLPERTIGFDHQGAHALRKGDWKIVWGKRMPHEIQWELYNLAQDRCETTDLAEQHPDRVKAMAAEWDQWARHVQVIYDALNSGGARAEAANNASPIIAGKQTSGRPEESRPQPLPRTEIAAGLKSHDRALFIKAGWIRDPYIVLAPDGYYYLTGTTPNPGDPREAADYYNVGLGDESIVGYKMQVWHSRDLAAWEYLGAPFSLLDGYWAQKQPDAFKGDDRSQWRLWAPELHFFDGRWHLVHTSPGPVRRGSNLAVVRGDALQGPYAFPLGDLSGERHDPSLFRDDDGTVYLLWGNTLIAPLTKDLTRFAAEPVRIDPSGSRPGPDGKPISRIGHEGATLRKISGKYVHFGTAWSTDQGRKGTYNLYYCTADSITGPYGPRRFAGRFLGHGTPFRDKNGKWWCTAFFNANVPPLARQQARGRDLSTDAFTINPQGTSIIPLDVRVGDDGDLYIRAKDPDYANPGPEEVQDFGKRKGNR